MIEAPADPVLAEDEAVAAEAGTTTSPGGVPYTMAQNADVSDLLDQLRVPAFLQRWYNRFYYDRKYVSDDALLLDTDKTVSVNYLYRNTQILAAQLLARQPEVRVVPKEMLGEQPPLLFDFGKTCELLTIDLLEEAGLRGKLKAAVPDAAGVGWAIFKVTPQEDYRLDAIGQSRYNDELDNIARCEWLRHRFKSGDIQVTDRAYQEMLDCEKQVAAYMQLKLQEDLQRNPPDEVPIVDPMTGMPMMDPVTGGPVTMPDPVDPRSIQVQQLDAGQIPDDLTLPEVSRYLGVNINRVMPEDFRFDWQVTDPVELRRQCRWMAHRVFMDRDAAGAKLSIPIEDWKRISVYDQNGVRTDRMWQHDPADRPDAGSASDAATPRWDDRCVVWEVWHKERGLVYTLVEGLPYPVAVEPPGVTWREWFPFFFLYFNRVDGRAIPMSDTALTRSLQDEINRLRTQDQQFRQWSLPRFIMRRGAMTSAEKAAAENSYAGQFLEMSFTDDVRQAWAQPAAVQYNPQVSDISPAKLAMQEMSGITAQAMGSSEGDLATTAAIANEYMGNQMDLRRDALEMLIQDVATCVMDYANAIMPEVNVVRRVGPGTVWPLVDRTDMFTMLALQVKAGSTGKPDLRQRKEFFSLLPTIVQTVLTNPALNGLEWLRETFRSFGITDPPEKYFSPQFLMLLKSGMLPPIAPPGGAPGGAPPGLPQGEPGPGAPTMADRGPPAPEQIPNGPMAAGQS